MVTIISGKVNSGKTSYLLQHYQQYREGDGFISRKILNGQKVFGFKSLRLSTKEEKPWMIDDAFYQGEFMNAGRVGPYWIDLNRLSEIEKSIERMIRKGVQPIYLDEVGRLELSGQGYDAMLKKLFLTHLNIIIAVRDDLTKLVIDRYQLKNYSIIEVHS